MIIEKKQYRYFNFILSYLRLSIFLLWEFIYDKLLFKSKLQINQKGVPQLEQGRSFKECQDCSLCIELCPEQALTKKQDEIELDLMQCTACEYCITVCPLHLLSVVEAPELVVNQENRFKSVAAKVL